MSRFISVSDPKQIEWHSNKAVIQYTISRTNSAYFGFCDYYTCLAIKRANGRYKYWGFPVKSKWKSSWGEPSWYLQASGRYRTNQFGNMDGVLFESQTFTDEITINRGNSRQGSVEVEVGVLAGSNVSSDFGTTTKKVRVYTSKIADASNVTLSVEVDPITEDERFITVKGGFTNPEGHYNMRLYRNGIQVNNFNGEYKEAITEDKFYNSINFELRIYGADGTYYKELTKQASSGIIEPAGAGVYIQTASEVADVSTMHLKNVTHKEISEVWINVNGKIIKTVK